MSLAKKEREQRARERAAVLAEELGQPAWKIEVALCETVPMDRKVYLHEVGLTEDAEGTLRTLDGKAVRDTTQENVDKFFGKSSYQQGLEAGVASTLREQVGLGSAYADAVAARVLAERIAEPTEKDDETEAADAWAAAQPEVQENRADAVAIPEVGNQESRADAVAIPEVQENRADAKDDEKSSSSSSSGEKSEQDEHAAVEQDDDDLSAKPGEVPGH
jgi:hypothetical protein